MELIMSKILKIFIFFVLNFCILTNAFSQQSAWNHNNSIVEISNEANNVNIYYLKPRLGLPVKSGDLLFNGVVNGYGILGTAYIFSEKCGPIAYEVSGYISNDQNSVRMTGKAPRRGSDCRVASYFDDTLNFNLVHGFTVFEPVGKNVIQPKQTNKKSTDPEDKELEKLRKKMEKYGD